ncbi:MAG: Ig-like domain-containing protein [Sphingobacteriales bacterium]|nr:Ig-like domain-containing protein [Sphingobacteriales bacterium]
MNRNLLRTALLCFALFGLAHIVRAQNGFEKLIVERYYVVGAADTVDSQLNGNLPLGAVTYRVYVDMAPVYRFQACYGVMGHELKLKTSTRFYNCPAADGILANDIHPTSLKVRAGMLDSWISVGAAGLDYQGVLKSEDDTTQSLVFENQQGMLRNNDTSAGIPLTERDGMRFLRLQPAVNSFNLEQDLRLFDYAKRNEVRGTIRTTDGAWASYGGTVGPQPENRVLIAQLTTDGLLELELNFQLAVPGGGSEKYVARAPQQDETLRTDLIFFSHPGKQAPVVELQANRASKRSIILQAEATDPDDSVKRVDFYNNERLVFSDFEAPFEFELKPPGTGSAGFFYAKAYDSAGIPSQSSTIKVD